MLPWLEEARLSAIEDWVEAELGCSNHAGMSAELDALVTGYPLRERLWGQRMRALSNAAGRPTRWAPTGS